jgi:hypothetical protein
MAQDRVNGGTFGHPFFKSRFLFLFLLFFRVFGFLCHVVCVVCVVCVVVSLAGLLATRHDTQSRLFLKKYFFTI